MGYSDDLIEQARQLVKAEKGRPRQASLRRAVSASYYALFHEVVQRAASEVVSRDVLTGPIGNRLRRVVTHQNILKSARWFVTTQPPETIREMRGGGGADATSASMKWMCQTFCDLQSHRHEADYDLSERFYRQDVARVIEDAEGCIRHLRGLPNSDETLVFLLGCLFGDALNRNA